MPDDDRLAREADFHDRRFNGEFERSSDEFYAITGSSNDAYNDIVSSIPEGASCLEIGCGPGSSAKILAQRGVDVTAIDISGAAIDLARRQAEIDGFEQIEFRLMDAAHLSFDAASFDAVVGKGILHHLDLAPAIAGIARVLTPTGIAAFREPMGHNPMLNMYRRMTPSERTVDEHPLTRSDLRSLDEWFDDVNLHFFHLASLMSIPLRRTTHFEQVLERLNRIDERLLAKSKFLQNMAWVVTIELRSPKVIQSGKR